MNIHDMIIKVRPGLKKLINNVPDKIPYASILVKTFNGNRYTLNPHRREVNALPPTFGITARVFDGTVIHEQTVTDISLSAAEILLQDLCKRAINNGLSARSIARAEVSSDFETISEIRPSSLTVTEKTFCLVDRLERVMNSYPKLSNAKMSVSEGEELSLFVDRDRDLFQRIDICTMNLTVYVTRNGKTQLASASQGGTRGWELTEIAETEIAEAVDKAGRFLEAKPVEPGAYTIIADPKTTGTIAHEAFGHGVELDMFVKNRARAADYFNKQVGSEKVNIVDDPSYEGLSGSYFFDDEGELSTETVILDRGVFKNGLSDMYSAMRLDLPRTPNGRRASITRKAYARMTNTFFKPGSDSVSDLIARVDDGIYLCDPWGGMEDPLGWGLQVDNHFGIRIRNGKLTDTLYSPIVMTGTVPEVLDSIDGVADDFDTMNLGMCGKGHKEYLRVSLGGPHIKLEARLG